MDRPLIALTIIISALVIGAVCVILGIYARDDGEGMILEEPVRSGGIDRNAEERIAQLQKELDSLSAEMQWLSNEFAILQSQSRESVNLKEEILSEASGTSRISDNPRWYLQRYIESFAGGGRGSEYFRLAVEAYAPDLLKEIGSIVLTPGADIVLRQRLTAILGDGRFTGNAYVTDILLNIIVYSGEDSVVRAALGALGRIGTSSTLPAIESVVWSIENEKYRAEAISLMARFLGAEANAALVRLFATARDDSDRIQVLSLIQEADSGSALETFRLASGQSQPVRLQGARQIGRFRSEEFPAFVDEWLSFESDASVRRELERAKNTQRQVPAWTAQQMVGPPDAIPANTDHRNAWASKSPNMGKQWIELGYSTPMHVHTVRIFEVNIAGAVTSVVGLEQSGKAHTLWSGIDPTQSAGVFQVKIPVTSYRVKRLRITLDTNRRSGWNEIDAVEIVGPEGRAWATEATASSSYGR